MPNKKTISSSSTLTDFFQEREMEGDDGQRKKVRVVIKPKTKEQARQLFPYRPFSKYSESRWGGDGLYDDICLLINGLAVRCKMCRAPTQNKFLEDGVCPDCDGRAEFSGYNPYK